jgi:hypothetical protein
VKLSDAQLQRIPIVKLSPPQFLDVVQAVSQSSGERGDVVRRILSIPHFKIGSPEHGPYDEKRAMRALVVPTTTRFHVARSRPPRFELAPNGRMIAELPRAEARAFVAMMLRDFGRYSLGLPVEALDPGVIRSSAKDKHTLDAVSGYARYLAEFAITGYDPGEDSTMGLVEGTLVPISNRTLEPLVFDAAKTTMAVRKVLGLDPLRYGIMSQLRRKNIILSSFAADHHIMALVRRMELVPMVASATSLESLIYNGKIPFNSVMMGNST